MAVSLKHKFASLKSDDADTTIVRPSNWNDEHDLLMATAKLMGRTTAATGVAEEIGVSGELTLASLTLGVGTTLSSKNLSAPVILDGYTEEIHILSGTTPAITPTNASIQTWTLSGNSTPTAGTWAEGQSITLMVNDNTTPFTVNWTSMPIVWVGGSAPVLTPSGGYTVIQLWKISTTIYGALVGQVT